MHARRDATAPAVNAPLAGTPETLVAKLEAEGLDAFGANTAYVIGTLADAGDLTLDHVRRLEAAAPTVADYIKDQLGEALPPDPLWGQEKMMEEYRYMQAANASIMRRYYLTRASRRCSTRRRPGVRRATAQGPGRRRRVAVNSGSSSDPPDEEGEPRGALVVRAPAPPRRRSVSPPLKLPAPRPQRLRRRPCGGGR
ncbi:MAG: hypothetical protein QOJ29_4280 [Thermoleophilaceae bacterium]|jgi:hypothetical protein|nr:hypothetical protein [Thermoleophilaceae bacterium]